MKWFKQIFYQEIRDNFVVFSTGFSSYNENSTGVIF